MTLEVWDHIPCAPDTDITYELSIDNGATWVSVDGWDEVWQSDADKNKVAQIDEATWTPGNPAYTYRKRRVDFAGLGLTGNEIRWRATLINLIENCASEPKILDLAISSTVMGGGEVSRASPVVKANALYSGSYELSDGTWSDDTPRGHLRVTRIYDPINPNTTATQDLWDAGAVLNSKSPADRTIYIPDVTYTTISNEQVGMGDGTTTVFAGTLSNSPLVAEELTITDAHESFTDKSTDELEGNLGGSGTINRFTGEFSITFNTPPGDGVPILADYEYYTTSSSLQEFKATNTNVTDLMLGIDDTFVIGEGYTYDFDGDGDFDANDKDWLVNWVRGYVDGVGTPKDWLLGAIDHSVPAVQTPPSAPSWFYGTAITEGERESFLSFVAAHNTRPTVVYAGARDGMLHAFDGGKFRWGDNLVTDDGDSNTDWDIEKRGYFLWEGDPAEPNYGTGEELWAFIPTNLISRLKNNVLQGDDRAYVDASPALADVFINGYWKTVLISAQGNGGDSVFALDVTDPYNPTFMWEFADPDLFRSRSSPSIAKIGRIVVEGQAVWVAFFVSGKTYNAALYPSIYMINVADGSVVERVFLNAEESGGPSGTGGVLSGQPTIIDSDGNGYIDRLYIGTDKGYLYKVNIPDDPDVPKYNISNCVINSDFEVDGGDSVSVDQQYHPIYGSPVVIVENGVDADGALTYDLRILFGTGDSPYYDEDIDMANTRYHFFAYRDQSKKGVCDDSQVSLDWFIELDEGHRIFASAFAAAGQVYFGTTTSETEDPCDGPSISGMTYLGDLYVVDIVDGPEDDPADNKKKHNVKITICPTVVDEHVYLKTPTVQSFGSGEYNNKTTKGGFPTVQIRSWHEIY